MMDEAVLSSGTFLCVSGFCCVSNLIIIGLCMMIAGSKNRSVLLWGLLGFLFSFFALIILIFLPKVQPVYPYGYAPPQPGYPPPPAPAPQPTPPQQPQWTSPPQAQSPTIIPQSSGTSWRLTIVGGPGSGQSYGLKLQTRLGRAADNEIALDDGEVSRYHAVIKRSEEGFTLIDQGSGNGTFVNGGRISQPTALAAGDTITIGQTQLRVG